MLRYFEDALEKLLPEAEYVKMTSHDSAAAKTSSRGDFHRCLHCAKWAVELADQPEHAHVAHLAHELREVVHEIHDTDYAVAFGVHEVFQGGRVITDVELAWVDEALKVAAAAATTSGWENVPWETLLVELIAIEPTST